MPVIFIAHGIASLQVDGDIGPWGLRPRSDHRGNLAHRIVDLCGLCCASRVGDQFGLSGKNAGRQGCNTLGDHPAVGAHPKDARSAIGIYKKVRVEGGLRVVFHCGAEAEGGLIRKLARTDVHATTGEVCWLVGREGFVEVQAFQCAGREEVDIDRSFIGIGGGKAATV